MASRNLAVLIADAHDCGEITILLQTEPALSIVELLPFITNKLCGPLKYRLL